MYGRYECFICSATSCVSPKTEGGAGQPPLSHAGHDHQPAGQWGFLDEANLAWFFIPGRVVGTGYRVSISVFLVFRMGVSNSSHS